MQAQKNSKGIKRNKTQIFLLCKEARRKKTSRFARQNLSTIHQQFRNPTLKDPLVQLQRMPTMSTLPPEWVDKFQQCTQNLQEINGLKKKIMTEQSRRLSCLKVSDEKDSQKKIYQYSALATSKLRKCEKMLGQIRKDAQPESEADQKTCKNINIQQATRQLRAQQRAFIEQRKQIENTTKVSFLELAAEKVMDEDDFEEDGTEMLQQKYTLQRNEQIMKIVESVQELNSIFKELNDLVIMQGSLLDRIDYNIDESLVHVKKGDRILTRIDERKKTSKCACRLIVLMIVAILIILIILMVRWFS